MTRPRITYLLVWGNAAAGTERAVYSQAASLRDFADVEVLSLILDREAPAGLVPDGLVVHHLLDVTSGAPRPVGTGHGLTDDEVTALHAQPSLIAARWEPALTGLTDVLIEEALRESQADILVTTAPALIPLAVRLAPDRIAVVHQDHRRSHMRGTTGEPLAQFGSMLDSMVFLTEEIRQAMTSRLGPGFPEFRTIANSIPAQPRPRSSLTNPLILGVGRMVPEKQLNHLIRAFGIATAEHPEWQLRLIGSGPAEGRLGRLVRALGLLGRVSFTGVLDHVGDEYAKASLLVLPSRSEGHPLVTLEAAAAGVPTIGYDTGVGPVLGHDERGLVVPPDDEAGLAWAIRRLIEDVPLRHRLGEAAYAWSSSTTPEHVAGDWRDLFGDLMSQRAAWSPEQTRSRLLRAAARARTIPSAPDGGARSLASASTIGGIAARNIAALGAVLAAAEVAHVAVPGDSWHRAQVAVRESDREPVLTALGEATDVAWMLASPQSPGVTYPISAVPGALAASAVVLVAGHAPALAIGGAARGLGAVELEFWAPSASTPGVLVAPQTNGRVSELTVSDVIDAVPGICQGVAFPVPRALAAPAVFTPAFEIDVVYTWVDDSDAAWRARRDLARADLTRADLGEGHHHEAAGGHRYRNRDELRYSLRSIDQFAPWVRHIYLVTDQQRPEWLDPASDRVTVVDHRDIWSDPSALPVFNSHAIESQLHHIPGLGEHFVYVNDDVLLGSPANPWDFFNAHGLSVFYPSSVTVDHTPDPPPHLAAARNNRALLLRDFGVEVTHSMLHVPMALRRSVLEELEERYAESFHATSHAPFRSPSDLSVASSLYPHYAFLTGRALAMPSQGRYTYIGLGAADLPERLGAILRGAPFDFIALGDQSSQAFDADEVDAMLGDMLGQFLPFPAPWEL